MDAYDAQMRAASGGPPADPAPAPAPVPAADQIVPTAAEAAPSAPNVVDGFNDVFGEQGRGNLIERKGVFQVQGGGLVDRAVVPPANWDGSQGAISRSTADNNPGRVANPSVNKLDDVVGKQDLVVNAEKQDSGWIVQGGATVDWNNKEFLN